MKHVMQPAVLAAAATCGVCPAQLIDPEGPLTRTAARLQVVEFEVTLWEQPADGEKYPFKMSMIVDGPWSVVDPETLRVTVHAGNELAVDRFGEMLGRPDGLGALELTAPMPETPRWPVVVKVRADVIAYASAIDESVAGGLPWPAAWPAALRDALKPEPLIESDSEIVRSALQQTVGEDPRAWGPPLAVAKRLIQAACVELNIDGQHLLHGPRKTVRGINVSGAKWALQNGGGSNADLTCVCVALLRAAGIPARPVIAVSTEEGSRDDALTVHGEFFLPEAGWVPFDASMLRKRGVGSRPITATWRGLGRLPDMDEVVPLSWTFAPDQGKKAYEAWSIWSWTRLAPDAEFPLGMGTGRIQIDDKVLITGQANLHSQVLARRWSKGPLQETPPSPWRAAP